MQAFARIWQEGACAAFGQRRVADRALELAKGALACLARRTLTGAIIARGRHLRDWSADYRVFERGRVNVGAMFDAVRRHALALVERDGPVVALIDDTLLRRSGRKVHGAAWRRDALGPKFRPNLVWAQRFVQLSLAVPDPDAEGRARAVPIDFTHCPGVPKGRKGDPPPTPEQRGAASLPTVAAGRIHALRRSLDDDGQAARHLIISGDGGYTNRGVIRRLAPNTTFVGRIRKDAKLFAPPAQAATPQTRGRKRAYGDPMPTPEQIRQDDQQPWHSVSAFAAGKTHQFRVKTAVVRWKSAGARDLRLLVVAPLGYKLTKKSRTLYRQPAFLISTGVQASLDLILKAYLWRWEIEVGFRDEKTGVGIGQAHMRTPSAATTHPAFLVATYAMLLLAASQCQPPAQPPPPKWRKSAPHQRLPTNQILATARIQLWEDQIPNGNFSGFANNNQTDPNPTKRLPQRLQTAIAYMNP